MGFLFGLSGLLAATHRNRVVSSNADTEDDWPVTVIEPRPVPRDARAGCRSLFAVGQDMQRAAAARGQVLGILVLKMSDLRELRGLFGRQAAEEMIAEVLAQLTVVAAGRAGVAVRTSPDTFALLVPGATGAEVHGTLRARLGQACSIEFERGGEEILLVPDVHARTIGDSESVADAYCAVCRTIESVRQMEESRCDSLRREREALTVPGELVAMSPRG